MAAMTHPAVQMADMMFAAITGEPVAYFRGNGRVGGEGSYYDLQAKGADRLALAADELDDEFVVAFHAGPYVNVRTPAFGTKRDSVVAVVQDSFSGKDGEAQLAALLNIVRAALKSREPAVLLPAQAWLCSFAKAHGEHHAADYVASQEDDE
jgi:hypothetical protein